MGRDHLKPWARRVHDASPLALRAYGYLVLLPLFVVVGAVDGALRGLREFMEEERLIRGAKRG